MDFHYSFFLLSILLFLSLQATADGTGSVFFLDSSIHQYFRPPSSDSVSECLNKQQTTTTANNMAGREVREYTNLTDPKDRKLGKGKDRIDDEDITFQRMVAKTDSMLLSEVGAAVSVLLGFAPPAMLSAAGSSRLNEVLMPNPFDRPRSVFMLDVRGAEDSQVMVQSGNAWFGSALRSRVLMESNKADIQLPDEDEVSVVSLNEPLSFGSDVELTDKELSDFASWLGGTYVANALKPMNGELTIPLASGARLNLHMSKKAEREFIMSLVSLISNIQRAMEMHQDLSGSMRNPAELITGSFDGIKVLQEEYGTEGVAEEGQELFFTSISKIFDSLQAVYRGQIVGVILCNGTPLPESETMLNVMITSRPSGRWLEETTGASNSTTIAEIVLVRRTLAWITGIILVIATLLGIYYLMSMPLTRDTLLYSNVKLD